MAGFSLSRQDIDILGKILDPESSADGVPRQDASLPKDPHITDPGEYAQVSQQERDLVLTLQQADMELAGLGSRTLPDPLATYRTAVEELGQLVSKYPKYASAMNNRAQALRRLYGDSMLLVSEPAVKSEQTEQTETGDSGITAAPPAILPAGAATSEERTQAAETVLVDLERAIALLLPMESPSASPAALSPTATKTLAQAFTQRGVLYYETSRQLGAGKICNSLVNRPEAKWSKEVFEEAAARSLDLGGRFGSELARELAVQINPTAKLCGQIVQQMMSDEYNPEAR